MEAIRGDIEMGVYRKKPVLVEAWKWNGDEGEAEAFEFYRDSTLECEYDEAGEFCGLYVRTLEGRMTVSPGDYVIRGVNGEYYPCKPDIFDKTYEAVE